VLYLLALFIPISFLYSPPVEKSGAVYVAKTMTISHERKTPAYTLFQQSQKILNPQNFRNVSSLETKAAPMSETLVLNENENSVAKLALQFSNATVVTEMSFNKTDLLSRTDNALNQIANFQQDSSLLNQLHAVKNNPFQNNQQSQSNAASIQGYFELSEGVGITNHKVTLRRIKEGQSIEIGQVDLNAGLYQIYVGSFDGELVAEIKDENGLIIGEDRKKISGLSRRNNYFQGPSLTLGKPSSFAVNLKNTDQRKINDSEVTASLFSGNYSLKKTTDSYPNVARHSSTIALIDSAQSKFARTLSIRTAKDTSEIILFSNNWVSGVKEYISEKIQIQFIQNAGLIIGRVMLDGKPVNGAQVVVENQPGLEPYYLDQFLIPQLSQSNTSSNGYFIIPGLQSGSYQIAAFIQNRHLGSQAYFVEENVVTYQEVISSTAVKVNSVRSFDAFTGFSVPSEIQVPGLEELVSVENENTIYNDGTKSGLIEIINRPTSVDYIPYIYLQNQAKDYVHLPQISDKFVDYLKQNTKYNIGITSLPETSVFLGFVKMKNYNITLADENFDRKNIIYFDSTGLLSITPIENGGFVIFNVPLGTQEIIIENKDDEKIFSQAFYSKDSMTYLAHFSE
jgi:hypothetical protein